jgi:hypothetical protein
LSLSTSLRAKRSNPASPRQARWVASSQVLLAMTAREFRFEFQTADARPHSRGGMRPRFAFRCPSKEGAGNAGCALHPRSRVQLLLAKTHTSIQVQRRRSDIPCAMALRLISRSPRRRIRLVTVVGELAASPRPVGPACLRQLDTSNGCQNHTTSPYATTPFVCAPFDRSRVWLNPKPALQFTCAPDAAACTASRPASMTMANAPLGDRTARDIDLSRVRRNGNIFAKRAGQAIH